MKIRPVKAQSPPITPAVMAMIGTLLTGCDRQRLPGEPPEQHLTSLEPPPTAPSPEKLPQLLGGDVPVENLNMD